MAPVPDGLVAVVKRDCPTCALVEPVLQQLAGAGPLTVVSQDDPGFPAGLPVTDDRELEVSWRLRIETVPTLLRVDGGTETGRVEGWLRSAWETFTGVEDLGPGLPEHRPGCGSRSVEWGVEEELARRYGGSVLAARRVELADLEDDVEAVYARGWSDGLPCVPPTEERVLRMLGGTSRSPDEVVAVVPPDLVECTVEKVAVNAVLAGCLPEHLPVVLAAVEAACRDEFALHGVLATTWSAGPVLVVNGPVTRRLRMNSGINVLGQGDRANATIGRALQLVVRNVGGGRPGEVDRATLGNPGKVGWCFAEADDGLRPFPPLAESRGVPGSALTVFAGAGLVPFLDQLSRTPESLTRTLALVLRTVGHPKAALGMDALVVLGPEHGRVFREAGWDRERLLAELEPLLVLQPDELRRGTLGIAEGMPDALLDRPLPKFRPGGLLLTYAGGPAGMFSAVIGGWASGATGSTPVTVPIEEA
ncbi:thioredoxin family protein [Geodermatophilus sp. FMUSA9-8]|uniref:thioredoxin family protein n=1 Tax=Geodermatophilus sp. FMUSA9-8 TaxID=3120155 RepID=UPI0030099540